MENTLIPASFPRRLAAILYDFFIVAALEFGAFALPTIFTHGRALNPHNPVIRMFVWVVLFCFFCGFWYKGGQTLGMLAWRIKLVALDGSKPTAVQVIIRFFGAVISFFTFGLGFIWALFDKQKRTWHDMLSETRLIVVKR